MKWIFVFHLLYQKTLMKIIWHDEQSRRKKTDVNWYAPIFFPVLIIASRQKKRWNEIKNAFNRYAKYMLKKKIVIWYDSIWTLNRIAYFNGNCLQWFFCPSLLPIYTVYMIMFNIVRCWMLCSSSKLLIIDLNNLYSIEVANVYNLSFILKLLQPQYFGHFTLEIFDQRNMGNMCFNHFICIVFFHFHRFFFPQMKFQYEMNDFHGKKSNLRFNYKLFRVCQFIFLFHFKTIFVMPFSFERKYAFEK